MREQVLIEQFNRFALTEPSGALIMLLNYLKKKIPAKELIFKFPNIPAADLVKNLLNMIKSKRQESDEIEIGGPKIGDFNIFAKNLKACLIFQDFENYSEKVLEFLYSLELSANFFVLKGIVFNTKNYPMTLVRIGNEFFLYKPCKIEKYENWKQFLLAVNEYELVPAFLMYSRTDKVVLDKTIEPIRTYMSLWSADKKKIPEEERKIPKNNLITMESSLKASIDLKFEGIGQRPIEFLKNHKEVVAKIGAVKPQHQNFNQATRASGNVEKSQVKKKISSESNGFSTFQAEKPPEIHPNNIKKGAMTAPVPLTATWLCPKCSELSSLNDYQCKCGHTHEMLERYLKEERATLIYCKICYKPAMDELCKACKQERNIHTIEKCGKCGKDPQICKGCPSDNAKKCLNCNEVSEKILCIECLKKDYWQCIHCTFINQHGNICDSCYKTNMQRPRNKSSVPVAKKK